MTNKYEHVGQKHNEGLDSIIDDFSEIDVIKSRENDFNLVQKFGYQYLEVQSLESPELSFAKKVFQNKAKSYSKSFTKGKRNGVRSKSVRDLRTSSNINEDQKIFLNKIKISLKESNDLEDFKNSIDEINKAASKKLSKKELELIVFSTTVAKASASYWKENAKKWEKVVANKISKSKQLNGNYLSMLTDGPEEPQEFDISLQQLANTDVVTATASAGVTLITGCEFYTLGACTAAAGIGGGILGSAADALSQLVGEAYDYFFNMRLSPINGPLKNNYRKPIPHDIKLNKSSFGILKSKFES